MVVRREPDAILPSCVLVVHDDLTWLRAASDGLRDAGFDVVFALSGAGALHHINEGLHPAVLVAAVNMAGIGGIELSDVIRDVSPATAIVLLAASVPRPSDLAGTSPATMLIEPFVIDDVVSCVRSALLRKDVKLYVDDLSEHDTPEHSGGTRLRDVAWSWLAAVLLILAVWLVIQLLSRSRP